MTKTLTVEGDLATVDAIANLTSQGSVTAPSLVTPAGVSRIKSIVAAIGAEGLANGSAVFLVRLGGSAVKGGEQTLIISAGGRIAPQAGSDAAPSICSPVLLEDLDIEVSASDTIRVQAEMAGSDLGTGYAVVTLLFG